MDQHGMSLVAHATLAWKWSLMENKCWQKQIKLDVWFKLAKQQLHETQHIRVIHYDWKSFIFWEKFRKKWFWQTKLIQYYLSISHLTINFVTINVCIQFPGSMRFLAYAVKHFKYISAIDHSINVYYLHWIFVQNKL